MWSVLQCGWYIQGFSVRENWLYLCQEESTENSFFVRCRTMCPLPCFGIEIPSVWNLGKHCMCAAIVSVSSYEHQHHCVWKAVFFEAYIHPPWLLTFFPLSLPQRFLSLKEEGFDEDISFTSEFSKVSCPLHSFQLWVFVFLPIHARECFFDAGQTRHWLKLKQLMNFKWKSIYSFLS